MDQQFRVLALGRSIFWVSGQLRLASVAERPQPGDMFDAVVDRDNSPERILAMFAHLKPGEPYILLGLSEIMRTVVRQVPLEALPRPRMMLFSAIKIAVHPDRVIIMKH